MNKKIALGCCVCIVLIVIVIAIILFFKPTFEYNLIQDMIDNYNSTKPQYEYDFGSFKYWLNPFDFSNIPGTNPTLTLALYDDKEASKGFNFNEIYIEPLKNGLKNAEKSIWDIITNRIITVTIKDIGTDDASANLYFVKKGTAVDSSLNSLIIEGEKTMARTYLVPGYKYWIGHNDIGLTTNLKDKAIQTDKRAASQNPFSFVFTPG